MFCVGHLFFGGVGMYFLARRWTGNPLAGAMAGMVFAFNGLTWHALMWPNNSAALGWMPWVVLAAERGWRDGGRWVIWAGLAGAMQMLAGAPEIIILTWFVTGVLWLAELARKELPRGRVGGRFFLAGLLTAGLAAVQLLPFFELLKHSQRGAGFADSAWAMPATGWLNFVVPLFHCFPDKGVFAQYGQFWTSSYYLGVGTVALAVLAVWRARDGRTRVLAGLAVFGLLMALGDNGGLYAWLKAAAPVMGFMRYPIKFVVLVTFVMPLLAARGLSWFQGLPEEKWEVERKRILRLGAGMLAMLAAGAVWEWVSPREHDDRAATVANAAVRAVFLGLILLCIAGWRRVAELKLQRLLRVCVLLLFWFDIYTYTPNLSPTVDTVAYEPDSVREYFKWDKELRPGESRAMESRASEDWLRYHSITTNAVADLNGRRLAMYSDYNLLDHLTKIDGFFSLELREMFRLETRIYTATNEMPKLMDFMGIARVSHETNLVDWVARGSFLPMITAGQEPVFAEDEAAFDGVSGAQFEPEQMVFLEPAARAAVTARRAGVKIISRSFQTQQAGAEVEADAAAMVVVAQAFYPCWHAYVDGKRVALWRANYAFQALEVPAGRHEVRLVYEDAAFKAGAMISAGTLVAAGVVWLRLGKRRKQV